MKPESTNFVIVPELDVPTPARVHRPSGTIYINADVWHLFTPAERLIILNHEQGHYRLQTTSEEQADLYGLQQIAGKFPNSLKTNFNLLMRVLDINNPVHRKRLFSLAKEIAKIDFAKFGNKKAINIYKKISQMETLDFSNPQSVMNWLENKRNIFLMERGYSSLDGLSDFKREALAKEFAENAEVHEVLDMLENHPESNWIGAAISAISSLFGGAKKDDGAAAAAKAQIEAAKAQAAAAEARAQTAQAEADKKKGMSTGAIIGIAGGVLVLVIVLAVVLMKK